MSRPKTGLTTAKRYEHIPGVGSTGGKIFSILLRVAGTAVLSGIMIGLYADWRHYGHTWSMLTLAIIIAIIVYWAGFWYLYLPWYESKYGRHGADKK